jgi:hypothetical protein
MSSSDQALTAALQQLSSSSRGKLQFRRITTKVLGRETGISLGRSPNPVYSFEINSPDELAVRLVAYTLTLDGTGRVATRAEALGRGLVATNGRLFDSNPCLLIYDYAGNRFMAVSAARLFGAFTQEIAKRPISQSPTATFSLTPSFQNRTISMYATVQEPYVWYCSVANGELTLEVLISGLNRIRDDTAALAPELPRIVNAIASRLGGDSSEQNGLFSPAVEVGIDGRAIEQIEGLDQEAGSGGWGEYPLDAVFVRTETRSVSEVVKRIQSKRYILDPDFQREFVWRVPKQSKLIESCVMRIPLPVFYVAEAPDGRIIVVDGLQRLGTFDRFLRDELKLTGLESSENPAHPLEGKYFKDLPLNLQERVQDTQLTMYILDAKAPERARLDIFERVNSGEPLTRQQMRNALYNGPATQWLKRAAGSDAFRSATANALNPKTMRDREAINRYCAFKLLGWRRYTSGEMDGFLADGLAALARLGESDRETLFHTFEHVMLLNKKLFGDHAFRKSLASQNAHAARSVINISLFEVCSVAMSDKALQSVAPSEQAKMRNAVVALLAREDFTRAITYSTNSTAAVQKRFSTMEMALAEALKS